MVEVSQTFALVFKIFSKIVAPSSDIVEISADGWKAVAFCKNTENRIEIDLQTVTLYCWTSGPLSWHPAWQTYKQKSPLFFISCHRASTNLHQTLRTHRGRRYIFASPNFCGSDPYFLRPGPPKILAKIVRSRFSGAYLHQAIYNWLSYWPLGACIHSNAWSTT